MKAARCIFLSDDKIWGSVNGWIATVIDTLNDTRDSGEAFYEYEPIWLDPGAGNLNGREYVDIFLSKIRAGFQGRDFAVVTDAQFGERPLGGSELLASIQSAPDLQPKFLRGLVYSIEPELSGGQSQDKVRALKRVENLSDPTHQARVILKYLMTGYLPQFKNVKILCSRLRDFLMFSLSLDPPELFTHNWALGDGVYSVYSPESVIVFDELKASLMQEGGILRQEESDMLSRILCPYESLFCAARLLPSTDTKRKGGGIRLLYELSNRQTLDSRRQRLCHRQPMFQEEWINYQVKKLKTTLDTWESSYPDSFSSLKAGIKWELNFITYILGIPEIAGND